MKIHLCYTNDSFCTPQAFVVKDNFVPEWSWHWRSFGLFTANEVRQMIASEFETNDTKLVLQNALLEISEKTK